MVSILILMDYQFLPKKKYYLSNKKQYVSILILMDYQFLPSRGRNIMTKKQRFNPYFNGLSILTIGMKLIPTSEMTVSILILMDYQFLLVFLSPMKK